MANDKVLKSEGSEYLTQTSPFNINNAIDTLANQNNDQFTDNLPSNQLDVYNKISGIDKATSIVERKQQRTTQKYIEANREIDPNGSLAIGDAAYEAVKQQTAQQKALLAANRAMLETENQVADLDYQNSMNQLAVQQQQLQDALTGRAVGINPKHYKSLITNYEDDMTDRIKDAQRVNEIQAKMGLLAGQADEVGARYAQQKGFNAIKMLKQEMAEDNLLKSESEASQELYKSLLQQSSDERYKDLIDTQATTDLNAKPYETDLLPNTIQTFREGLANIPKGIGAVINDRVLTDEEKKQRQRAFETLNPDSAPKTLVGDTLIKIGNAIAGGDDKQYSSKYNVDNLVADYQSNRGAVDTALGLGKQLGGMAVETIGGSLPEILLTAGSAKAATSAVKGVTALTKAGLTNSIEKLGTKVASNIATNTGKVETTAFINKAFKGYSEAKRAEIASTLPKSMDTVTAGKIFKELVAKDPELTKALLGTSSGKRLSLEALGGTLGLTSEVAGKMQEAQENRYEQKKIGSKDLNYLLSINKADAIPAAIYTGLNLVEFGTLIKPLIGNTLSRSLMKAATDKDGAKIIELLKAGATEAKKSSFSSVAGTMLLKAIVNSGSEGATEFAQTLMENMMRDRSLDFSIGSYNKALKDALADPKSYKEISDSAITGALVGAGTASVDNAKQAVSKGISKATDKVSSYLTKKAKETTAEATTAKNNISAVSNLNGAIESDNTPDLKDIYNVAVSPKAKEAFVTEADTGKNSRYKELVNTIASITPDTDVNALAEETAFKLPEYTEADLKDYFTLARDKNSKYTEYDTKDLSQSMKDTIDSVTEDVYNNTYKPILNKDFADTTVSERFTMGQKLQSNAKKEEAKEEETPKDTTPLEVTKSNNPVMKLEGTSKSDQSKANTYALPIDATSGELQNVSPEHINNFNDTFSKENLVGADNKVKNKADVKKALRSFSLTLGIANATGNDTQAAALKNTYIGQLIQHIKENVLQKNNRNDVVKAYKILTKDDGIEKALLDDIIEYIKEQPIDKEGYTNLRSALTDYLLSSDIVEPSKEKVDTTKVKSPTLANNAPSKGQTVMDNLEALVNTHLGDDSRTRKLRNVNRMTSSGALAAKVSTALNKLNVAQLIKESYGTKAENRLLTTESMVKAFTTLVKDIARLQKQTENKINVLSVLQDSSNLNEILEKYGITKTNIEEYLFNPTDNPKAGIGNLSVVLRIDQYTGKVTPILPKDLPKYLNGRDVSKINELDGMDNYLMYIPLVKDSQDTYRLSSAISVKKEGDKSDGIPFLSTLKREQEALSTALNTIKNEIAKNTPDYEKYLDMSTFKRDTEITNKLTQIFSNIKVMTDKSAKTAIKDTFKLLTQANQDIDKLNRYISEVEKGIDVQSLGEVRNTTLSTATLSLSNAKSLRDIVLADRDKLLLNIQIFFDTNKDAADIMALVASYNASKLSQEDMNPYLSDSLSGKAMALLKRVVDFFHRGDTALAKFNKALKQVNSVRVAEGREAIDIDQLEFLSGYMVNTDPKKKLSSADRTNIINTSLAVIRALDTQSQMKYGFGDTNNLLSELLPSVEDILNNKDSIDLSKNLIGGYFVPDVRRLSSYSMFNTYFPMKDYQIKSLPYGKFKDMMKKAVKSLAGSTNYDNLFLDLFNLAAKNDSNGFLTEPTELKEAVIRSMYFSIVGMLSNEKLVGAIANMNSNIKDTEANQKVSSTYQASIIANDFLRNLGLSIPSPNKTSGDVSDAQEQLKNMFQSLIKDAFAGERDLGVELDSKTNVIKLKSKDSLSEAQDLAAKLSNNGYITPKEIAAKNHISDILRDIKLSQKGNSFSTETDPRVVDGILSQALTPLIYDTTKMNAMKQYLASNGKALANEVISTLADIKAPDNLLKNGKITLTEPLFNEQITPILLQTAGALGVSDIKQYIADFKESMIDIDSNLNNNPAATAILNASIIPMINNKIQQVLEVAQESNSDRGTKGVQFYYNTKAGPNDRTTIEGTGHQQSNKAIRHLIRKNTDKDEAKKPFMNMAKEHISKSTDIKETTKNSDKYMLIAIGSALDILNLSKVADGAYRDQLLALQEEYADKIDKSETLLEKLDLIEDRQKRIEKIVESDKEAFQKILDDKLSPEGKLAATYNALKEVIVTNYDFDKPDSSIASLIESIKAKDDFAKVPSYILADIIPAIAHYEAGKNKAKTSDEVLEALFDGLDNLQTLETDGQTFGPASINILNYIERASRKLALGGNLTLSEDPLMYMDDDNYNYTAQILFSNWFAPILDKKLGDIAGDKTDIHQVKYALIDALMLNVYEYEKNSDKLEAHRNLLDMVISNSIFKDVTNVESMLDKSIQDILNDKLQYIRALSKPILQLSGYGSGVTNNTKGFTNSFFMKNFPTLYTKIASKFSKASDKISEANLYANKDVMAILTPSDVITLKTLEVKSLKDFHNLVKVDDNGELNFTTLDTITTRLAESLTGVVTQALQRISPFQAQRTNLVMRVLKDHVQQLVKEVNKVIPEAYRGKIKYVTEGDKEGSIDITDVPEKVFTDAIKKIADSKDNTKSSLVGILMSGENSSITNFIRRSMEAIDEKQSDVTPVNTRAKVSKIYFSPVDLSLVTNFGQSMDAKVQGIVQKKLADMGIVIALDNYDAFTTYAPLLPLISKLANEAFAELIMDDNANLCETMLKQALINEQTWYEKANTADKVALGETISLIDNYLMGLQVAKDLRTLNGTQVDNFRGNYGLDAYGNPQTVAIVEGIKDPNSKAYKEAIARLYPASGIDSQKAFEFYTRLVPTFEWLNSYKDMIDNAYLVITHLKNLVKKQVELGAEYTNEDTVAKSEKILKAIDNYLNNTKQEDMKDIKNFFRAMSKDIPYSAFSALDKLQDTFFTTSPTKNITPANPLLGNKMLGNAEYGKHYATIQNATYKTDMTNAESMTSTLSRQSNMYITNLNKARDTLFPMKIWTLNYIDDGFSFSDGTKDPITKKDVSYTIDDAMKAMTNGEVYTISKEASEALKKLGTEDDLKLQLQDLSNIRGIKANNIGFKLSDFKNDMLKDISTDKPSQLKDKVVSYVTNKLNSNNYGEFLTGMHILTNVLPSLVSDAETGISDALKEQIKAARNQLETDLLDPKKITSLNDPKGKRLFTFDNSLDLNTQLTTSVTPSTIYRGFSFDNNPKDGEVALPDMSVEPLEDYDAEATDLNKLAIESDKLHSPHSSEIAELTELEKEINEALTKDFRVGDDLQDLEDTFNELSDLSGIDQAQKDMYVSLLRRFFTKTDGNRFFKDGLRIMLFKTAGEPIGDFDTKTNTISIYLGDVTKSSIGMTPIEVYMHELLHAVTEYAIRSNEPEIQSIVKNAEDIRAKVMKQYNSNKAKLDLANRLGMTGTDSKKIADVTKAYIDYMNGSISEFIAIAMTNKEIQADIANVDKEKGKGFIERLVRFFSRLLNALTNTPQEITLDNSTGSQAVYELAVRLANNNNNLKSVYKDLRYRNTLQKWLGLANKLTNNTVGKWIDNQSIKLEAGNPAKNIYSLVEYIAFATRNPTIAHKAMDLLVNKFNFSPMGFMATTLSNMSTLDDPKRMVNELLAKSANLDKERLLLHTSLEKELRNNFSRELSKQESKDLGKIIQTYDLRAIDDDITRIYLDYFSGKTNADTRTRIRNEITSTLNVIKANMGTYVEAKHKNRISSLFAYYDKETQNLANYLSKGQISSNMLLNAYNIAQAITLPDVVDNRRLYGSEEEIISQTNVSALAQKLDKLISLRALVNANDSLLTSFRDLYEDDKTHNGVINAFNMHKMSKNGLEDELLTKGLISNEVKGYVRTRTNESVDIIVAPLSDKNTLAGEGYTLVKDYTNIFNFGGKNGLGMYISTTNMQPKFNRGVIRTTSNSSRGMTIQSAVNNLYPLETTDKKRAIVAQLITKLKKDNRNQSEEFVPVFNAKGEIVDYRLLLSQHQKEELEIANTDLFDTLPNAVVRYMDRTQSEKHNQETLKELAKFYQENRGKEEFIYIGPNGIEAHNPKIKNKSDLLQIQEIWDLMPNTTKDYISNNLVGMDQGIYVQASQFASIAGSRDFRLTNTDTFNRIVPFAYFKRLAKLLEYGIIKGGKWVTQKIVLTNPDVIIGNLASNQLVLTTFGLDPVTSMKYYAEAISYIKAYNYLKEKEVILKKDIELSKNKRNPKAEADLEKIRDKMEDNPIYEFDKKGLISDIAEDLPKTEEQQDFIDRAIEKSLNKVGVPQAFREAFDVVMVNEGTTLHSAYASLVKYSDLVARYALWKHMKLTDNLTPQDMFDLLDRAFINYTPAQHPILKYANDIGFARFTKYWIRAQSHISSDLLGSRLGATMLTHGALKLMGVPISSPLNAIFFRKFMNYDTTFGLPGVTDIDEIYDDLADGLIITNPLVALKKLF